jgi:iron(III) transport system substrate-binding protein
VTDKNYALVNERYITILYNTNLMDGEELPTNFVDLTDPQYSDRLAIADAMQSSTAFAMATVFYAMSGNNGDYFQAWKDNNIILSKSNGGTASGVMEGQFALGVAPYDPLVRLRNKGKKEGYEVPMDVIWPTDGAIAIQRPIAIPVSTSRTPEQEAIAKAYVNWMFSKQAQTITNKFGFVSVRTDIPNEHLPADAAVYTVDWEMGNANEEAVKDIYQESFY